VDVLAAPRGGPPPDGVIVGLRLLSAAVLLACTAAVAAPAPAVAAASSGDGPLEVVSGGGTGTHQLVPGATVVWPIEVTVRVPRLDALLGTLSVAGGLGRSGDVTAEVASCAVDWDGDRCPSGALTVLAPTPLDRLPQASAALQSAPRPGTTHVQVRIHVASDARIPEDATMTATLRVDASGPDAPGTGGSGSGGSGSDATLTITSLANTGAQVSDYGGLAVGAVATGLVLAGLAALIQRRRRTHA
jgi:hypothetical protein